MISRNLIIEWRTSIERALMVRFPPKNMYLAEAAVEIINDLKQIEILGLQSASLQKQIENLRTARNEISSRFPLASKEEKELLKKEVYEYKNRIQTLEEEYTKIETQCQRHESRIPNIPDENIPLWENISDFDIKCVRTNLRFVKSLINQFNH